MSTFSEAKTDPATIDTVEAVIRDIAGNIVGLVRQREAHPSHGITKASIRSKNDRLEGVLGTYLVLTGQALHAFAPTNVITFADPETAEIVNRARDAVATL